MKISIFPDREFLSSPVAGRLICLGLALSVLAVFGRVTGYDFVFFDDHVYVMEKAQVLAGLTPASLQWSLTATDAGFWHPLTWISLMLDREIWGLNPGGYHLTNVLLHLTATLLLFAALHRLTGALWKSGFVAALFALHPLHVESVAWIAERKDVLSGVFWMLTLLLYARYAAKPGWGRYLSVLVSFVLGLAAKPMVVTLPLILLLLDIWPLGRLTGDNRRRQWRRVVGEKLPLLALGAVAGVVTVAAERQVGALKTFAEFSFPDRLTNAVVAYGFYLYKTVLPVGLAVHYPHPGSWPAGIVALSLGFLALVGIIAWRRRRTAPYLLVGWLWYLVGLLPVIGLLQIGSHAFADRYSYIPLIGVFIAVVWGLGEWADVSGKGPFTEKKQNDDRPTAVPLAAWETVGIGQCVAASLKKDDPAVSPVAVAVAGLAVVVVFALISVRQVGHWQNAETLFRRAVAVTSDNWLALNNLGAALSRQGRHGEAAPHFAAALRLRPDYTEALFNLGAALAGQGRYGEALSVYRRVLAQQPAFAEAHNNIAIAYAETGDVARARFHFREAIRLRPDYREALRNLEILEKKKIE